MRKHIGQSLKTRSKAIQAAIITYNEAAAALKPPRQPISWDEIVDFSYLSEFSILRDAREDVRKRDWASPQNRQLMLEFFKIMGAENELTRLHVEIKHLVTYMRDEKRKVLGKATELEAEDPGLALQLRLYWQERGRFDELHQKCLFAIRRLPGFNHVNNHYFVLGTYVSEPQVPVGDLHAQDLHSEREDIEMRDPNDWEDGDDEEEDEEEESGDLDSCIAAVLDVTIDGE